MLARSKLAALPCAGLLVLGYLALVWVLATLLGCELLVEPCGVSAGSVAQVRDGDTIVLADGEVIRYLSVDTPERDACFGAEARAANVEMVAGADIVLDDDVRCRDVYGRRLAYVSVDGVDVGAKLLERGFARLDVIPPNDARAEEYKRLAEAARSAGRGLWAACR